MDRADISPLDRVRLALSAALRATGFVASSMQGKPIPETDTDKLLLYGRALQAACTELVTVEKELETLREEIRRGPNATSLQEEVAVAG